MSLITSEQLQRAAGITPELTRRWHPHILAVMQQSSIHTPRRVAAFIAQTGHESQGFTRTVESFNYSIDGLTLFGQRLTDDQRQLLGRKPSEKLLPVERQRAIANLVYGGRMGNKVPGDGWKYRGRGLIHITGLDNYLNCGRAQGIDLITSPELLESEQYAAQSAGWFWSESHCNELADISDIVSITRRINGGKNGLDDRLKRYKLACDILGVSV